ncbi:hypothetical protein MKEN_01158600 [Mycena kentingensis (nom. inval.)]|nr:hypothetical protein MKEN_01158600 [Mycena kentingensis (nom. inval.)]
MRLRKLFASTPRNRALTRRESSSATPVAPIVVGAVLGAVALILIGCLVGMYIQRRKEVHEEVDSPDILSRPFPIEAKPGHSRTQPALSTFPAPPAPVEIASPHRRKRRRHMAAPPAPIIPPPLPPAEGEAPRRTRHHRDRDRERTRARRGEISNAERDRERDRERRNRSSTSKSILGLRWHLPPISEGYGVGLMTRESLDFRRLPSYTPAGG